MVEHRWKSSGSPFVPLEATSPRSDVAFPASPWTIPNLVIPEIRNWPEDEHGEEQECAAEGCRLEDDAAEGAGGSAAAPPGAAPPAPPPQSPHHPPMHPPPPRHIPRFPTASSFIVQRFPFAFRIYR